MRVEVIGKNYKATLSHEDIRKIVDCIRMYGDFYYYTFLGEIEDLNDENKEMRLEMTIDMKRESEETSE